MNETQITLVDENGNEILYDVLLPFDSEDFNKSYILIAPSESKDDDENVEVLCFSYDLNEDGTIKQLYPVETEEEWDMIEEVFNTELPFEDDDYDDEDEDDDDHECCGGHHHHDDDHECCGGHHHHDDDEDDHHCGCGHK